MAVTEQGRFVLYEHFEEDMGEEKARILMDHLLPVGWAELATKQDLRELELATRHDLQALELATRHDLKELELATRHALRELEVATKHDLKELRLELTTEMHKGFTSQTRFLVGTMVGLQGVLLAALKLF